MGSERNGYYNRTYNLLGSKFGRSWQFSKELTLELVFEMLPNCDVRFEEISCSAEATANKFLVASRIFALVDCTKG